MQGSASAWASAPRTFEGHIDTIFSKLGLEQTPDDNRRVLAVLTWLRGSDGGSAG